ncbi:hypothetical protein AN644_01930 [Candidatus Epulonipiscium fishelsonii]|nr:hypothetical protein AN644_01930 [Epulopiscium sp. SCG-C06WGA-EpuloA1]
MQLKLEDLDKSSTRWKVDISTTNFKVSNIKYQFIRDGIEIGIERGIEIGIERGIEIGIERGIEIGIEQGIKIGIERGIEIGKIEILYKKFQYSIEQISEELNKSLEYVSDVVNSLKL